ncbi:MAG TPA: HlyD family efflux transporter periplasmic adaptor subunit [Burkholderiaceae bacterium]|nr:HlyD family efflux transporter periplasmic adaptor subunit [Burkholderiaceae bacterium]
MPVSAPIYSLAEEHRSHAEAAAWSRFVAAASDEEFCASWLNLLAARVARARAALLLVADDKGQAFGVTAAWPDPRRDLQYLGPVAQRALTERCGVVTAPGGGEPGSDGAAHVGYPVEVGGQLCAAVVFDIGADAAVAAGQADLQAALRQIHWASAWLIDHFRQRLLALREAELGRVAALNELMATALQHRRCEPSALAVANDLAPRLRCDRVSVGFEQSGRMVPSVMSHTATFDTRSDLVRNLGEAMDEVLDLGVAVAFPPAGDDELGAIAHADAARVLQVQALLSVPLVANGETIGVITFERNAGPAFDAAEQRLAAAVGTMLGPVWAVQRTNERSAWQRTRESARGFLQATFGPRHPGLKLLVSTIALLLLAFTLIQADHRVSARTVVEGATQAAQVAPFEGYVAEALVRAGDSVKRGQAMARLDERDLKLERARWSAEREQLQRRFQVALAAADRGAMGVLSAQVNQAEAQLALAEEKLARATLVAPFDGLVVSGDLSQSIGSPVEQGKVLFEVAPLEGFRVVLQVDDRDIGRVAVGQSGALVLSSLPDQTLPFTISTVTPVATQQDGRNVFRVEARIDSPAAARLRPGMEGIGKVTVGERSLMWIWTHSFFDWLRLSLWNWMP